jgi:hypothetical protein
MRVAIITRRVGNLAELKFPGDYVTLPDQGIVMICVLCGNWFELGGPRCYPHSIVSTDPLTIAPSVVCPWQSCHYVVSGGRC